VAIPHSNRPPFPSNAGQLNPNANDIPVPVGIGPAPMNPSQPRAGNVQRRIILPGADYPPADAIPVDEIGDGSIAAGATAVLVSVIVPDTRSFRMAGIGFGADDESALRFLSWTINATPPGVPIPGYTNKPATIGSIPQLAYIFTVLGSSVTVEVLGTNNSVLTHYFVCRLQGWFYTEKEAA
jgi:hypothetical protein